MYVLKGVYALIIEVKMSPKPDGGEENSVITGVPGDGVSKGSGSVKTA